MDAVSVKFLEISSHMQDIFALQMTELVNVSRRINKSNILFFIHFKHSSDAMETIFLFTSESL